MTPAEATALNRRLLWLAGLLGLALVAVLANAAFSGGGSDDSANPIRAAALRTEREAGGHGLIQIRYSSTSGNTTETDGKSVFNFNNGHSRARLETPSNEGGRQSLVTYASPDAVYAAWPELNPVLPTGYGWLRVEPWLGSGLISLSSRLSPPTEVAMLKAARGVEDLGGEVVQGVDTERYGAEVDLDDFAAALAGEGDADAAARFRALAAKVTTPIRVEGWVDSSGRLRRTRSSTTLPLIYPGEPTVTVDIKVDLFDYGPVAVRAVPIPATGKPLDLSAYFRWQLGLPVGPGFTGLGTTGAPLPVDGFRARARAICRSVTAQGHRVVRQLAPTLAAMTRVAEENGASDASRRRIQAILRLGVIAYDRPYLKVENEFVARLGELSAPREDQTRWTMYLKALARLNEGLAAQVDAIEIEAFGAAGEIGKELKEYEHSTDVLGHALDLDTCVVAAHSYEPPPNDVQREKNRA